MPSYLSSEVREPDEAGVFQLIGVMIVSGRRGEGKFVAAPGWSNRSDEFQQRILRCLAAGESLDNLLAYLFDRANGITISWSEPEAVSGRDLDEAARTALAEAVRRDRADSQAHSGLPD